MERTTGLLDIYAARKRKRQVSSSGESDVAPIQSAEPSQPATNDQPAADRSSRDQAIIIPSSLELGPTIRQGSDGAGRSDLNEGDPALRALQVILPSDQGEEP